MKNKLTVTIDAALIPRAKRYARARGVSLSSVIEEALEALVKDQQPSFAERWRGRFQANSGEDDRYRTLTEKYL